MTTYYFKPKNTSLYILISYDYMPLKKKIELNRLLFCKTEQNINDFIKDFNLERPSSLKKTEEREKIVKLEELINDYFTGKKVDLFERLKQLDIQINLRKIFKGDFSYQVIKSLLQVKNGETTSYFQLGEKINSKGYRAIGNVLKSNPLPLIIPCHRVIRKDGKIGGFMGIEKNGWETNLKKKLLRIEGNSY